MSNADRPATLEIERSSVKEAEMAEALAGGYRTAMTVAAGLAFVAAVISVRFVGGRTRRGSTALGVSGGTNENGIRRSRDVEKRAVLSS
jgi:hypothetical protein